MTISGQSESQQDGPALTLLEVIIYELQREKVYHNSLWPGGLAALAITARR